jgi:[ribosomal protein S18]-alanine N-acetyltransferase
MIVVEAGDAHDIAAIMPIMDDAFDPAFGEAWTASQAMSLLAMPGSKLLIARDDDRITGFAMTRWVFDEEELLMIGVSKTFQRYKIGSQLLHYIINQAMEAKRKKLFLEVRDGNDAQRFYKALGFLETGRRKNYYKGLDGLLFDAITMFRRLK